MTTCREGATPPGRAGEVEAYVKETPSSDANERSVSIASNSKAASPTCCDDATTSEPASRPAGPVSRTPPSARPSPSTPSGCAPP